MTTCLPVLCFYFLSTYFSQDLQCFFLRSEKKGRYHFIVVTFLLSREVNGTKKYEFFPIPNTAYLEGFAGVHLLAHAHFVKGNSAMYHSLKIFNTELSLRLTPNVLSKHEE